MRAQKRTIDCCDTACVYCALTFAYPFPFLFGQFIQFHERSINAACPVSDNPYHSHCDSASHPRVFSPIPRRRRLAACTCSAGHLLDSRRAFICFYICPRFQLNASSLGWPWIAVWASKSHGERLIPTASEGNRVLGLLGTFKRFINCYSFERDIFPIQHV